MAAKSRVAAQRSWRERSTVASETPEIRRTKRWLMTAIVLGMLGVFVWQVVPLFRTIPQVRLACLRVINYDKLAVPLIPFAEENASSFTKLLGDNASTFKALETTATFGSLASQLRAFASRPIDHLVVYVNAHGVASGDQAELLCSDYLRRIKSDQPLASGSAGRIAIDDLIKHVGEAPAAEKLIILDCGYLPCDARSGVIGNEFATAVAHRVAESKDPHLWVLLSNSVHELSQPSYANRRSLLADAIVQAVHGSADADQDGVVDLFELAGYVCQQVPQEASARQLRKQTPVLLWGGGTATLPTDQRLFPIHVVKVEPDAAKADAGKTDSKAKDPSAKEKTAARPAPRPLWSTALVGVLSSNPVLIAQVPAPAADAQQPAKPAGEPAQKADGGATPTVSDVGKPQAADATKKDPATTPAASEKAAGTDKPATADKSASGDGQPAATSDAAKPQATDAVVKPDPQSKPAVQPKAAKPKPLEQLWHSRDEMLLRTPEQPFNPIDYAPLDWREFEELLLHYERQYRFGDERTRKELEGQIARLSNFSNKTSTTELSSTGPLGDVLPRLTIARQEFDGSPAQRALLLDSPRAAGLRKAVQARNDALYRARDFIRWHAAVTLGAGKPHALLDPIRQFIDETAELSRLVIDELEREEASQANPALSEQIDKVAELEATIQTQISVPVDDPHSTAAQIEELLATPLLDGKTRARLIESLEKRGGKPLPASGPVAAKIVLSVSDSKDAWQRSTEQAELELKLASLAGDAAKVTAAMKTATEPKARCRQVAASLESFYRTLPAQLKTVAPTESRLAGTAEQALRLVDARDATAIGKANIPAQVAWLPMPKGELKIDPIRSSLELKAKEWAALAVTLRSTPDFEKPVSFALEYKADELEVRSGDETIDVTSGASSKIKFNRDLTRSIALEIRPRSTAPGSYPLAIVVAASDRPVHRAEVQCISTLELPNRVDLVIARDAAMPSDPYVAAIDHDRWRLRPYPNRQTTYQVALQNQSGKAKKVSVELYSIVRPQSNDKLVNERGALFSTLRPKRLAASAQPIDLPASTTPVPLALASAQAPPPPVEQPKEGEKPAAAPPKPPAPSIDGALVYVIREVGGDELAWPQLVELSTLAPKDYMLPRVHYEKGSISVEIRSQSPELLPPLSPEQPMLIDWTFDDPRLAKRDPSGRFSDALQDSGASSTLTAFVGSDHEEKVRMYLHVDHYPRAFIYEVPCTQDPVDNVDPWRAARAEIFQPLTGFVSKPLSALKTSLHVDAPDAFKQREDELVIGIDLGPGGRGSDRRWTDLDPPRLRFHADRQTRLTLEEVGAGTIKIGAAVGDYELDLASLGIKNQKFDVVGQLVLPRPDAPPDGIAEEARVTVIFDEQPPVIDSIAVEPRRSVELGKPLSLRVEASDGELSGVDKIFWALDDKQANGVLDDAEKDPPRMLRYLPERGVWLAIVDTKADVPKPDPLGNRIFVWGLDKAGNASEPELVEFKITQPVEPAAKIAAKKGTIRGKVVLQQMGGSPTFNLVAVSLKEDKPLGGKVKYTTKANTDGSFVFKNVDVGSYVVEAKGYVKNAEKEGATSVVLAPSPDDPAKPPVEEVQVEVGKPMPKPAPPKPM